MRDPGRDSGGAPIVKAGIFAGVGWAIYLVLHIVGLIWPKRNMLLLIILLLVVNLVGCQVM